MAGSAEAFKVAGIANGHGLNGTTKWSVHFIILVGRMVTSLNFITFSKKAENAFSTDGFRNWKDATRIYRKHELSHAHKEAVNRFTMQNPNQ